MPAGDVVPYSNRTVGIAAKISLYGESVIEVVTSIYTNVKRWRNNEISGERCAKNIIDDTTTIGGALAGAAGGAAVGSFGGPIGAAIGGVVGAVSGAALARLLIEMLTEKLFDLPKTEALEKAYQFMGLHHKCSNEEVNQRYKKLALVYHPDKQGGSQEKFLMLSSCVAIIKVARESE